MPTTIQPILTCDQTTSSDMTVSLTAGGTAYEVYLGVALLERVGAAAESVARKMLVGRLYNAGRTLRELGEQFGHDGRTIKKWASALLSGDIDVIARAFAGRAGKRKTSPELMRYVWQLHRDRHRLGRNYREIIIEKIAEVFGVRISTTTASALFAADPDRCPEPLPPQKRATDLQIGPSASSEESVSVKQSPIALPAQTDGAAPGKQWIHHAGQALFAGEMKGIDEPLQRQFIGQILQGAVNVEQSKTLCAHSLAQFTGPVLSGLKSQRDHLDMLASEAEVHGAYARNAELLSDGPNRGDLFYFDPHTKEYTGQLKVLKGWCGRQHAVVKSLNLDSFHTRSGRPCFICHYSAYYDMRDRFFLSLVRFDLLFDESKRQGRTFVIDRGIYSLVVLRRFGSDAVITWEKGYKGGGWEQSIPTIQFSRSRPGNSSEDQRTTVFECQESPWHRDRSFRRILVRVCREGEEPIELSVITSHADMDMQDVVWAICRRWLQENDFKYLDTHFGINQLTSRDSASFRGRAEFFEDRPVDSPEYRELKAAIHGLESHLAKNLLTLRRAEKQGMALQNATMVLKAEGKRVLSNLKGTLDRLQNGQSIPRAMEKINDGIGQLRRKRQELERRSRKNAEGQTQLQQQAARYEGRIEALEAQLCEAVRKESRLQLLINGDYRLLDTRKKAMMDALRVTAANIFRNIQERFRAIYDNFRDDHVFIRMLSRCSGSMEKTDDAVIFRLWLLGTLQAHRIRAIETLLGQIEEETNAAISAPRAIRLQLTAGPQTV